LGFAQFASRRGRKIDEVSYRCRNDAAFAALAGTSPLPASSGRTVRHRLNRGAARAQPRDPHHRHDPRTLLPDHPRLHRPPHRRGQDPKETRRCLKRYITRELYRTLTATMTSKNQPSTP
jgi:transposase